MILDELIARRKEEEAARHDAAERAGWKHIDQGNLHTRPTIEGRYAVMVSGDEERDGPHVFYSYDDYQTVADGRLDEFEAGDNGDFIDAIRFYGEHDEEDETIFAWFGPLGNGQEAPPYGREVPAAAPDREEKHG